MELDIRELKTEQRHTVRKEDLHEAVTRLSPGAPANSTGCPRVGLRRGLPIEQAGTDLRVWSGCVGGDVGSPEEARRSERGSARRSAQELSNGTGTGASWPKARAR